jgi:hypothetical protein
LSQSPAVPSPLPQIPHFDNGIPVRGQQVRGEFEEATCRAFWQPVVESRPSATVAAETAGTPAAIRQARSRILRRLREETGDPIE